MTSRRVFAAKHTTRWVLANVATFDRKHLGGALQWLFAQPALKVRTVRPMRRIIPFTGAAVWIAFVVFAWAHVPPMVKVPSTNWTCSPPSLLTADLNAFWIAALAAVFAGVAVSAFLRGFTRGWRRSRKPPVLTRSVLRSEFSDGTVRERLISPSAKITITSGRLYEGDSRR